MSRIFFLATEKFMEIKPRAYDLDKKYFGHTKEDLLQWIVAKHPEVIPWELITDDPDAKVITVRREAGVTPGSMDVLVLDSTAIPTIVEAKLFENRREIRRMMLGQAIEYAANLCLEWDAARIRHEGKLWRKEHQEGNEKEEDFEKAAIKELSPSDPAQFWDKVDRNLREGNIRIVYLCDRIPPEIRRTVEFLNHFCDFEVYGLEARLYEYEDHFILTPELIGPSPADKTEKEQERGRKGLVKRWTREEFLALFEEPGARKVVEELLEFGEKLPEVGDPFYSPSQTGSAIFRSGGLYLYTGTDSTSPSCGMSA